MKNLTTRKAGMVLALVLTMDCGHGGPGYTTRPKTNTIETVAPPRQRTPPSGVALTGPETTRPSEPTQTPTAPDVVPCGDPAFIFAGRAYVGALLCPNGRVPGQSSVATGFASKAGCMTDAYRLVCDDGSTATVEIAGGQPPPAPPPGWVLLTPSEQANWNDANQSAAKTPKTSEDLLDKLIHDHPNFASFFRLRGVARTAQKRIGDAVADLNRAVTLTPGNRLYRLERAELRLRDGQTTGAIEDLLELDKGADSSWDYSREWLGVTARALQEAGHPRAPEFLRRACAAGIKDLCAPKRNTPAK